MRENKALQISILISLAAHGVVLSQNPGWFNFSRDKKEEKIEINYVRKPPEYKPQPKNNFSKKIKNEPFMKLPDKITAQKRIPPPYVEKNNLTQASRPLLGVKADVNRPALIQTEAISIKKKIILPAVPDADKINNPSYISYYQIVREKIRRAAFRNYNGKEVGEVTLSFVVSSDGNLQKILLMEEISSKSDYLRDIAVNSIKSAAPFPAFPKELDYPYLLFKLHIDFEIE